MQIICFFCNIVPLNVTVTINLYVVFENKKVLHWHPVKSSSLPSRDKSRKVAGLTVHSDKILAFLYMVNQLYDLCNAVQER